MEKLYWLEEIVMIKNDGRIIKLSLEEARIRDEANKKAISDPELIEKAIEENKQRYKNKIRRKGYK